MEVLKKTSLDWIPIREKYDFTLTKEINKNFKIPNGKITSR
jgi:hypothetical protein